MTDAEFNAFLATIKPMPQKNTPAIIVDIDGTVARSVKRDPHEVEEMKNYERIFYTVGVAYDWVKNDPREKRKILFVTGRPEKARAATKAWIDFKSFGIEPDLYELYMRPSIMNDLPGAQFKYEIYKNYIHDKYNVKFVMENSLRACQMYRALGLNVLHVMSSKKPWSEKD